jgi:hypothetical protein
MTDYKQLCADYKQLCAELVELGSSPARSVSELAERMSQVMDLADRARAALAEPEPQRRCIYNPVQIAECGGPCEQGPEHCDCGELWVTEPEPKEPTSRQLMMLADDMEMASVSDAVEYARAVLARWGNHPGFPDSSAADGEMAGIAEWLKKRGRLADLGTKDWYFRAADLLERLSPPQPVPVSERLPGPGDCDAEGRCWIGYPEYTFPIGDTGDYDQMDPEWRLEEPPILLVATTSRAIWLPAHALPLPS